MTTEQKNNTPANPDFEQPTPLFAEYAPKYWAKGISVMPLHIMSKIPIAKAWSVWCKELPSQQQQEEWLKYRVYSNMGVCLGPQSNLVFLDIDTEEPHLLAAISSVTPESPWVRVGAKGCMMAYKYNGEAAKKISEKGKPGHIVEILSLGNQAVLPPSIHPTTGLPYFESVSLLEVYDTLPSLPDNYFELLRQALSKVVELGDSTGQKFNPLEFATPGTRDVQMTKFAGTLGYAVVAGRVTLSDALDAMSGWVTNCVVHVEGDALDHSKALSKVVEFVKKTVIKGRPLAVGWDEGLSIEQKHEWGLDFSEDQEQWTVQQLSDYMITEFSKCTGGGSDPERYKIIDYVMNKAIKSNIPPIQEGQIISLLKKHSGVDLSQAYYTKELKRLRSGPIAGESHGEIAEALKDLWEETNGELTFYGTGFWTWNGAYWEKVEEQVLWDLIIKNFGDLPYAKKASDHKGILVVLSKILSQDVINQDTDSQNCGINFLNGFLTRDLRLIPHQPEQGMTYTLPYSYKPKLAALPHKFLKYLEWSWGEHADYKEKLVALQEAFAATLFGLAPVFQRCFCLYGPGGTGKSVLLQVAQALVHDDARTSVKPEEWHNEYRLAMLSGKLLNFAGEISKDKRIEGATFKTVVGGEPIMARNIFLPPFIFKSKAAHWFAGNYMPKTRDGSEGFNRRWLMFQFDRLVPASEKILDLGALIISDEMEAIAAWALEAFPELIKRGSYTIPSSHWDIVGQMSETNNPIRAWLREKVVFDPSKSINFSELNSSFWSYQAVNLSGKNISPAEFESELIQILMETKQYNVKQTENGRIFTGLCLKVGRK